MTKREFLDIVFALAPNEANKIMDAFDEYVESNEPPEECERCMMEHTDEMEKLEAELAMAQPKRGRWILDRSGAYCCSECMEPCAGYVMMKPRDKYCKMCGSRNEVTK